MVLNCQIIRLEVAWDKEKGENSQNKLSNAFGVFVWNPSDTLVVGVFLKIIERGIKGKKKKNRNTLSKGRES